MCYFRSDTQSQEAVSGATVLRSYVSIICRSATDILQQATGLIARNFKLFEPMSKVVATEITGLCPAL